MVGRVRLLIVPLQGSHGTRGFQGEIRLPRVSRSGILVRYMLLNLSAVVLQPDFWQATVFGGALRVPILEFLH